MKKTTISTNMAIIAVSIIMSLVSMAMAETTPIQYNCSHQVYDAFEKSELEAFTKVTGIPVDLALASSYSCAHRIMQDMTDIAATTQALHKHHKNHGLIEVPFCKNPLAIIANKSLTVENITRTELEEIFSGAITNWKELGGPDIPITLVVTDRDTSAHKFFSRQVMHHKEIEYDYTTSQPSRVLEAIESLPAGAVSFSFLGAQIRNHSIKTLTLDGKKPSDKEYPLYQTFYLVTKGQPKGSIKSFVDFIQSDTAQAMIWSNGMLPIQ